MTDQFDYESVKQAAIKGLYEGKSLTGQDGLFAPLRRHFLEAALAGELGTHLSQTRHIEQNRRNGKTTKSVKSSAGLLDLTSPRDRSGTYQPQTVGRCHCSQTADGAYAPVGAETGPPERSLTSSALSLRNESNPTASINPADTV